MKIIKYPNRKISHISIMKYQVREVGDWKTRSVWIYILRKPIFG